MYVLGSMLVHAYSSMEGGCLFVIAVRPASWGSSPLSRSLPLSALYVARFLLLPDPFCVCLTIDHEECTKR